MKKVSLVGTLRYLGGGIDRNAGHFAGLGCDLYAE